MKTNVICKFGDIYLANLRGDTNIQGGVRPVLIVQNNVGNMYSSTVEVIPMSSKTEKARHLPTHVVVKMSTGNRLQADSLVLTEQTVTIHKERLIRYIGKMGWTDMAAIGKARMIQSPFQLVA